MRIDCKDKELWGNVLVTIEWLVTFIFLIFDRGEKILRQRNLPLQKQGAPARHAPFFDIGAETVGGTKRER